MKKLFFVIFLGFMLTAVMVFSDETGGKPQWGIFDHVYQNPKEKPGRIEISGDEADPVYDLFVQGQTDLYTKRSGSWRLSAKTQLMNPEINNPCWGNGIIVFEGDISNHQTMDYAPLFYRLFGGSDDANQGETIRLNSKGTTDEMMGDTSVYDRIAKRGEPIYLRITKYAPTGLYFSEYSLDGRNWLFFDFRYLDSKDDASYGLSCWTFHAGSPAHYRVSQVRLEPVSPFAQRIFSISAFQPNQRIRVRLEVVNPGSESVSAVVREQTPPHWKISDISPRAACDRNEITWRRELPPGVTLFSYTIQATSHPGWYANFRGSVDDAAIIGVHELKSIYALNIYMINLVVVFLLFLIHFTLFIFNPQQKENLFFSLYAFSYLCTSGGSYYYSEAITQNMWVIFIVCVTAQIIFLNGFFNSLFFNKVSPLFWMYLGIEIVLFSYELWMDVHIDIIFFSYELFLGVNYAMIHSFLFLWISLDCIRILGLAVYRRIPGIWIAAIGGIICIYPYVLWQSDVFGILPAWIYEINMKFWSTFHISVMEFTEWTILFFLIFTSIYLSFRFARMTKNLNQLNVELEDRVARRTVELERANEELRELDQMKSQFVSQASHDLRTPLTAIKGSLDNLLMGIAGDLNEKQSKIMERATKSVDRLTNLINDVLDLNRIETGRIVLEKTEIPFKTLVENIIHENRPAADKKQIQLSFEAKKGDYTLHIDGGKMERVIGELVSNAIKYTPDQGTVSVNLGIGDEHVSLSVQDSGIGMTPDECGKVWERFYRTTASKKFAKGSGLGLSIAKELVELHGGTLSVESEQWEGTTFKLQIPK